MTPERYQQIDQIFQAALVLEPERRAAYLNEACSGDENLRHEVDSLITSDEGGLSFIDEPAFEMAARVLASNEPALAAGDHIDRYEVVSLLGSGGMGEVYLAHDEKLDRTIALKLLPSHFTQNQERLRRFQQEARAASALNHPNILTIHELGEADGRQFIATEFVEGETLRARLKRAPLTLAETLDIAIQIAGALAAAHKTGIVHRDIKPENIMLRHDGYVKVLDFGLAKLTEQDEQIPHVQATENVNISSGLVMGTLKYMSPEQAQGQQVDQRSDIFSLGVVLYEMVAGRPPFEGETARSLVSAILNDEPVALKQHAPNAPEELQNILSKALRKNGRERYRLADDLLVDLKELKRKSETPRQHIIDKIKTHKIGATVAITALILVIAGISLGIFKFLAQKKSVARSEGIKITELTTNGKARDAAISPDGKFVAYVVVDAGQETIWIRQVETDRTVQIVSPAVRLAALTFSRDGNYLYYVKYDSRDTTENALYKVSVQGGDSRKIAEQVHCPISFSPDGKQFAFFRRYDEGENALLIANEDGTGEQELARRRGSERFADYPSGPAWSHDGKVIACGARRVGRGYELIEIRIADHSERTITSQEWAAVSGVSWLPEGKGLVVGALEKEPSQEKSQIWRVTYPGGEVERLTNDLDGYGFVSSAAYSPVLVATRGVTVENIWTVPTNDINRAKQITFGSSSYYGVCWTPDGRIVYSLGTSRSWGIWIMDADGTHQLNLTSEYADLPSVSPDGRYILFRRFDVRRSSDSLWRMDIDGSNQKELIRDIDTWSGWFAGTFTPDSKWVVVRLDSGWCKVPIDGGDAEKIEIDKKADRLAISPDGKWNAYRYLVKANPQPLVIVAPVEGLAPIKRLAVPSYDDMGNAIKWAADGRAVLFVDTHARISNIWSLPIDGSAPKQLTDFKSEQIAGFDLSPDGKQLACVRGNLIADVVLISGIDK
jgi:serine/threonine protein kinase/Tol biopolymer transport system component